MNDDRDTFDKLAAIRTLKIDETLARPGVTGVATGYRKKNGVLTDEPAIIVFVEKKKARSLLTAADVMDFGGAAVDIQEMGPVVAQYRHARPGAEAASASPICRPLIGGIEIGPTGDDVLGTLGAILYDPKTSLLAGLTCWHVIAGSETTANDRPVSQPGNLAADRIGVCGTAAIGTTDYGDVDAASIVLNPAIGCQVLQLASIGKIFAGRPATIGLLVTKQAAVTGTVPGMVTALDWSGDVSYGFGKKRFTNQIVIEPVSGPAASVAGDSGAVWLSGRDHGLIGLHFSGDGHYSIVNPIGAVLAATGLAVTCGVGAVYRWRHPLSKDHFYTEDWRGEQAPTSGYLYEGVDFRLFNDGAPQTVPFHRWCNPVTCDHFYTQDPKCEGLSGYIYEGIIGGIAPKEGIAGSRPLYRWFDAVSNDHFYTTDLQGEGLGAQGYVSQGEAGWVMPF